MNCFLCKGILGDGLTTHTVNLDRCIIIIKHVLCIICEQCGETYFDDETTARLDKIIGKVKNVVSDVAILEFEKTAS